MCAALPNGSICHYAWADERITQPVRLSACDYVSHLFGWVQRQLDSEDIFPTESSRPFPADFRSIVSKIFRRLFRVYAHAYHNHYERMVALSFLPHINTCFKHFMYFVLEFDLIPRKEELAPLQQLVDKLLSADERKRS